MTALAIVALALVSAAAASEIALGGTKLQTGLARVLVAWGLVYLVAIWWVLTTGQVSPIAFTVLWGGAFLSWFGVRSHIESSILLRMLVLLSRRPMAARQLIADYTVRCGEDARLEELCKGGLAQREGNRAVATVKGQKILRVVARLR